MRPFNESFGTARDVERASAEEVGVAIVLHVQARRIGRIAPSNFAGETNSMFGPGGTSTEFSNVISEGFQWAANALLLIPDLTQPPPWLVLSRYGQHFEPARDMERVRLDKLLPDFLLHPTVKSASLDIFKIGRYDAAVFEAFKALESLIREKAGFGTGEHGMGMATKAFHHDKGPLTLSDDPSGEREAMQYLMAGAVGVFKNPRSHRNTDLTDPKEAAEMLIIASNLIRIVESRDRH